MPILVPADIVAVPRVSPPRIRKRTPVRWLSEPGAATTRPGAREWFGDGVFVESRDGHPRTGYGLSLVLHLCAVVPLLALLMAGTDELIIVALSPEMPIPAFVVPPAEPAREPAAAPAAARPAAAAVAAVARTQTVAPPPPPPAGDPDAAAPIEAPSGITPETGNEGRTAGVAGGVPGGIAGGVVGGTGDVVTASGPPGPAMVRAGTDVKAPRKIKDVKPVYPAVAMPTRAQGAVLIEAIVGPDGKVRDAKVVHSVPLLDRAALDAVSQWEYEPTILNGVPVSVLMTVVVRFALQ